ncbi:NAD(P)H-hydrate dehydratase [Mesobacterium sp. TK19101]|uniref:Bifunctional NAD(P)H-hydrate repair enzyme n=1 Tax=Mesobacterium hydrothermale TaxID=3111907 RepID=A0ABU6HC98_9RHOB|nr:NAD(P)H-hydrate dehydratase [Mesobacterium sp. TK19101]MEC3860074.1 NAD(P)H-hydrate dehydratase [Mesobacterium sp. TK19101]
MSELLTAAQMRALEQRAMASGDVTGAELMSRAGEGVVAAIFETWPDLQQGARRAVVLCGPGNNGGDGYVIARVLAERGWTVSAFVLGDPSKLPPDARANHDLWLTCAPFADVKPIDTLSRTDCVAADLLIDALFGTGLNRALDNDLHAALWQALDGDTPVVDRVVAVDVPSGLCADSGRLLGRDGLRTSSSWDDGAGSLGTGHALAADLTVTFHAPRLGHVLQDGPRLCGRVVVKDIGLPDLSRSDLVYARLVAAPVHVARKGCFAHKFDHGHAVVLSGGAGRSGAARLSARAALRIGAGLVTLAVPPAAATEVASQITAEMLRVVPDADALFDLLGDDRITALCLGPGLGLGREAAALVRRTLSENRGTVLDADALTLLARMDDAWRLLHRRCVLTPHGGEFARLFPDIAESLAARPQTGPAMSRVDAVRAAARRAGCTVLLKGPDTVIAGPDGGVAVHDASHDRAAPWLATAGAGDVLAGVITGLLARGMTPFKAAKAGVWVHTEAARSFGPGLVATDLPDAIPRVLRELAEG